MSSPATDKEGAIKFPKLTSSTYANPDSYVTWLTNVWNNVSSIPLPDKYRYRIIERIVGRDAKTKKDKILMVPITDLVTHLEQIVPEPTLENLNPDLADTLDKIDDDQIEQWATLHAGWSQAEAKITTLIAAHLDHDLGLIFAQGNGFAYDKLAHLQRHVKYRKADAITDLIDQINRVKQGPTEMPTAYARKAGYPNQSSPTVVPEFKLDVATKFIRGLRPELRAPLKTVFDAKGISGRFDHMKEYLEDAELEEARSALQRGDDPPTATARAFAADNQTASTVGTHPTPTPAAPTTLEALVAAVTELKMENTRLHAALSSIGQDTRRGTNTNNGSTKEVNPCAVFVKGFPDGTTEAELSAHFQPDATARIFRMFRGGRAAIIDLGTAAGGARGLTTSKKFKGVELTIEQANKRFSNYSVQLSFHASTSPTRSGPHEAHPDPSTVISVSGLLDSTCTKSLTPHADTLSNTSASTPSSFLGVSGTVITGSGTRGDIHGTATNGQPIVISDVEHVPGASETLFSVPAILRSGSDVWFRSVTRTGYIGSLHTDCGTVTASAPGDDRGLFRLNLSSRSLNPATETVLLGAGLPGRRTIDLWHSRLLHASAKQIKRTLPAVHGLDISGSIPAVLPCEPCILGKMHRRPHAPAPPRSARILDTISADILFPERHHPSLGGGSCFLGISVHHTGLKFGYVQTSRDETAANLIFAKNWLERMTGEKLGTIHMDFAGENRPTSLHDVCRDVGITIAYTSTADHAQNGEIEGWFRTAFDRVRANLIETGAPRSLWGEGLLAHCHIHNRLVATNNTATPYELTFGKKPQLSDARILNCIAYARRVDADRIKTGARAIKGRFIGWGNYDGHPIQRLSYKILTDDTDPMAIIISRHVYFAERHFDIDRPPPTSALLTRWKDHHDDSDPADSDALPTALGTNSDVDDRPANNDDVSDDDEPLLPPPRAAPLAFNCPRLPPQRSPRLVLVLFVTTPPPNRGGSPRVFVNLRPNKPPRPLNRPMQSPSWNGPTKSQFTSPTSSPTSTPPSPPSPPYPARPNIQAALRDPLWRAAIDKELQQMEDVGAYRLAPIPAGAKPLHFLWVLKLKRNDDDGTIQHKARLVVNESRQTPDTYGKTFASTPSMTANKVFTAIAMQRHMKTRKFDVKGAYLNASMDHELYCLPPPGFTVPANQHGSGWKILKAIYGTRQGAYLWATFRNRHLTEYGFRKCFADPNLFRLDTPSGMLMLIIHTDDGELAADPGCEPDVDRFLSWLNSNMTITTADIVGHFIGIRKHYTPDYATMDQHDYIAAIIAECLEDPLTSDGRPTTRLTPWNGNTDTVDFDSDIAATPHDRAFMKQRDYYRLLGLVQYAGDTRPDILFTLGKLGRHSHNPRPVHWRALQHLLAYLNGSNDRCLTFSRTSEPLSITTYTDADHAGDTATRRSTSGFAVMLCGGAVSSSSKLQRTVADSTVAAETVAANRAAKATIHVRNLLTFLGHNLPPTAIYTDNMGLLRNSEEGALRHETKHLVIQYMFLRAQINPDHGPASLTLQHIHTSAMIADVLTKGLGGNKHAFFRDALGVITRSDAGDCKEATTRVRCGARRVNADGNTPPIHARP